MKKAFTFFTTMTMALSLAFIVSSCKDDPIEPKPQPNGQENVDNELNLSNTSWISTLDASENNSGTIVNYNCVINLDFIDDSIGECYQSMRVSIPSIDRSYNGEANYIFTYTVDNNTISMTINPESEGESSTVIELTYNPENETLIWNNYLVDEDVIELFGTSYLTFTKVQ